MLNNDNEVITKGFIKDLFNDQFDKRFGYLHTYLDTHFDGIYKRFDDIDTEIRGINNRLDFTNRRIDNHLLDCVRQEQHHRLENRVLKLEKA